MNTDAPADPTARPMVSIVICTVPSRRDYLDRALESLVRNEDIARTEVLLVAEDQAFLDDVAHAFADRLRVTCALSPTKGLSDKRNVGARAARGDVVAYLDDDAIAAPDYAQALERVFADGTACVAGVVEPIFEADVPDALRPSLFRVGGFNRFEDQVHPDRWVGANFAARRDVLLAMEPFDTRLGPGATYLPWGDDAEMFRRLAAEHGMRFTPDVSVRHHVQAERLTTRYVLTRMFRTGRTLCVIDRLHQPDFWKRARFVPVMWLKALLDLPLAGFSFAARLRLRNLSGYVLQMAVLAVGGLPKK